MYRRPLSGHPALHGIDRLSFLFIASVMRQIQHKPLAAVDNLMPMRVNVRLSAQSFLSSRGG
jgi:hypothetical protein